jgi:hypothetical protein
MTEWFERAQSKVLKALPWVSLCWGVATAVMTSRDVSEPGRLFAAGIGFVALAWAANRILVRFQERGRKVWDFVSGVALQSAAQYILLFVLPFLYLTQRWTALLVSAAFAAVTLWDPWWVRFYKHPTFLSLLKQWLCGLSLAPIIVVFFPWALPWLFLVVAAVMLFVVDWRQGGRWIAMAILPFLCVAQHVLVLSWPMAPIAIWLKEPGFSLGRPVFVDRESFQGRVDRLEIAQSDTAQKDHVLLQELCCATPIIAGRGFEAPIRHSWLLNGQVMDDIDLKTAKGNGEQASFRTHSCKKQFPKLKDGDVIACKARAGGSVLLGGVSIRVQEAKAEP